MKQNHVYKIKSIAYVKIIFMENDCPKRNFWLLKMGGTSDLDDLFCFCCCISNLVLAFHNQVLLICLPVTEIHPHNRKKTLYKLN